MDSVTRQPQEPFEAQLDRAGITRDKPLRTVLMTIHEAVETVRADRTSKVVEERVRNAAARGIATACAEAVRVWRWRRWAAVISAASVVVLAAGSAGFWLGQDQGRETAARLGAWCAAAAHITQQGGGTFCLVPTGQ